LKELDPTARGGGQWAEKDSNLRTLTRTDLQSVAFSHSAICPILTSIHGYAGDFGEELANIKLHPHPVKEFFA
jgi:hypothetical protein